MKIVRNILVGFFLVIIFVLSLAFIVIEGRLLLSLDWTIYDNVVFGFLRYFFRFLIAIVTSIYVILEFINMKKKSEKLNFILFIYNICLVIVSVFLLAEATNMVGEIAILLSLIILLIKGLFIFLINLKNKTNKA
jgi:hypothetical protein